MSTFGHRSDTISHARQGATDLFNAYDKMRAAQSAWDREVKAQIVDATGSDPKAVGYQANDFLGNEGIVKSDINQALGPALTALTAFFDTADGKKIADIRI